MSENSSVRRPSRLEARLQGSRLQAVSRQANAQSEIVAEQITMAQARRDAHREFVRSRWTFGAQVARQMAASRANPQAQGGDEDSRTQLLAMSLQSHQNHEARSSMGNNLRKSLDRRAARTSAAMAFAGRAKVQGDAATVIQKYMRRWLARRRLRELKFALRMGTQGKASSVKVTDITEASEVVQSRRASARSASADLVLESREPSRKPCPTTPTPPTYHNRRTRPRSASWHFSPDRQPLMAIEMQRRADRRVHLRKASAERKENQPQHPSVTAPLTQQQEVKVARRNHPHSRQSTPTSACERPPRLPTSDTPEPSSEPPTASVPRPPQRSGAASYIVQMPLNPRKLPAAGAGKPPVHVASSSDRVWTPGGAHKDEHNWLGVLKHEDAYTKLQRALTPARVEQPAQRMPLQLAVQATQHLVAAAGEHVPEDPAAIVHIMTQTQQGASLANVDSCFRMLAGRYKQFWALPDTHTVDERDWAHRQQLNKIQPPEGELYMPLNGRMVRTGEDISAVIEELNRALTPSLEEFRARTAPVATEGRAIVSQFDGCSESEAALADQDEAQHRHTDTGSLGYMQESAVDGSEDNGNLKEGDYESETVIGLIRETSRGSGHGSWEGSVGNAQQQDDRHGDASQSAVEDTEKQSSREGSTNKSLLCSNDTATGQPELHSLGPMHMSVSENNGDVRHAADPQLAEEDEDVIYSLSIPSDASEVSIPVPAPEVTDFGLYRGEGKCGSPPGGRRYENARRGNKGKLLKASGRSRKGRPRFMRALTRAPTFTTRVLAEQRELYMIADRDHMLAPCTPLKTNPIGSSPHPRLKMSQSKVWSYWSASRRSSAVATQRTATFNIGRVGMSDTGSLGHLTFAEQSSCGTGVSNLQERSKSRPTSSYAQVRFEENDRLPIAAQTPRPSSQPAMSQMAVLPPASVALPQASSTLSIAAANSRSGAMEPKTDVAAASENMDAAAALIHTRQKHLDHYNAQLYHSRKNQHRIEGVQWHETPQVPGDPWQPNQMLPTRVGIISRSLLPCATRGVQPAAQPQTVHRAAMCTARDRMDTQLPERERSFHIQQIQAASRSCLPSLVGAKHG